MNEQFYLTWKKYLTKFVLYQKPVFTLEAKTSTALEFFIFFIISALTIWLSLPLQINITSETSNRQ